MTDNRTGLAAQPAQAARPGRTSNSARKARAAHERARRERELARARRRRIIMAGSSVGGVLLLIAVMVVVRLGTSRAPATAAPAGIASSTVVDALAKVPPSLLDRIGRGETGALPVRITQQPPLSEAGKPLIVYIGAEYCPFCAAQRWGLVVALSRFGTFTGLGAARSGLDDVYPGTATLTFHGSSYTSPYLAFTGVELATSERRGGSYTPLDSLTPAQSAILATYDAPPYVPAASKGAVPFVDLGNRYLMLGATFSPALLAGLDHGQIAAALTDASSPVARAILGSANAFTTALCQLTGGQPAAVCTTAAATAYPELAK